MAKSPMDTRNDKGHTSISVQVDLRGGQGHERPDMRAYVFDRAGRLLGTALIDEKTTVTIKPSLDYRVTVGPDFIQSDKAPPADLLALLAKAQALSLDSRYQQVADYRFTPQWVQWICWLPTCINVHGTVRKLLNPGGSPAQYASICTGTVEIFEVDLGCTLDSFTVVDLFDFRARLLAKLAPAQYASLDAAFARAAGPVTRISSGLSLARSTGSLAAGSAAPSLGTLAANLAVLDGPALKQYIVQNKAHLHPFWCEFISDYAFCWQKLTDAQIQSDGAFSAEICFWCPDDMPDLYFEVTQNIAGSSVEISDPQIACSTYYGYDGSHSVDITVDDPRAVACQPAGPAGPGYLYVWPTAIGNIDLGGIDGLETGVGTGLLPGDTPWGGTLCLQMQFHPDLQANNIHYYRWSYRFDGETDFSQIHASVTHRYETITISGPDIIIHLNPVTFGPQLVSGPSNLAGTSNLFAIPDPLLPWIDINDPADRPFAYFDSTGGGTIFKSGMCTLMLELFDADGKFVPANNLRGFSTDGDHVGDPGGPGAFTYILPQIGGPPNTYTNAPTPNVTDHGRLTFRVRVDNNATSAELPAVSTPFGSTITDPCGMLHYTSKAVDNVDLSYVANHPNDFIDWSLGISRGVTGGVAGLSGNASAGTHFAPAHFVNTAGALLGTCDQAAFAVNLDCYARAQSGYGRQSQYDSSATIAFALITP